MHVTCGVSLAWQVVFEVSGVKDDGGGEVSHWWWQLPTNAPFDSLWVENRTAWNPARLL